MRTTVLIPAAGKGERLGFPIPKELLPISSGRVAIDSTFDLLQPLKAEITVLIVVSFQKMELLRYLEKYTKDFDISFVFQKQAYPEFMGALKTALPFFNESIILLLPDQIISFDVDNNPIQQAIKILKSSPACFIAAYENNFELLKDDGALRLEQSNKGLVVTQYVEKPTVPEWNLNAVWASIGFKKSITEDLFKIMESNFEGLLHKEEFEKSIFYKSPALLIDNYRDLGTWQRYQKWISEQ